MNMPLPINNQSLPDRVFQEILPLFLLEIEKAIAGIHSGVYRDDRSSVKRFAHLLKGGAASYGAVTLQEISSNLEMAALNDSEEMKSQIRALEAEALRIAEYCQAEFGVQLSPIPEKALKCQINSILLIDDDPAVCAYNKELLKALFADTNIVTFTEAKAAFGYMLNIEYKRDNKFLILVDFFMPELDGFAFMKKVEELDVILTNQLYVYLLTMDDSIRTQEMVEESMLLKVLLEKPLDVQFLKEQLLNEGLLVPDS